MKLFLRFKTAKAMRGDTKKAEESISPKQLLYKSDMSIKLLHWICSWFQLYILRTRAI